ncbi:MAG: hypothetical protein QOD06_2475, partial [Candidatus Binatota bacterium]|nr:hypothetical protein [Candidatus Binatota bacterium]
LHRAGWCGITWPVEHGGRGATPFEHAIYNEEMARAQAPEPINRVGLNNVGPTLIRWGTDEQQRRWLGRILSAEDIWCQLFSEPDAGSDLAALRTRAERDGDAYRLTGQKVWTSYAHFSRWAICLARTDAVAAKHAGITYFVVDMTASGITIRPLRQLTGSAEFNEVFLDAVAVPRDQVIGRENDGWTVAVSTLAHERGTGYLFKEQVKARIAVERLIERVRRRRDGADPVHPLLRQEVARAFIGVEVLRTLNLDTLSRLARGHEPGAESSLKKEFWSRLTQQLHDTAMAIDGTASQLAAGDTRAIDGGRWPAAYLFSRAATIAGGTSEIQLDVIARRLLGLPRR